MEYWSIGVMWNMEMDVATIANHDSITPITPVLHYLPLLDYSNTPLLQFASFIMNHDQPAIVVKDLDMGYGDFVLMRNLNFTVNRGDVFIIMGGSGCGKSTLLKILVGLKNPSRGQVFYGDTNFWDADSGTRETDPEAVRDTLSERGSVEFHDSG